MIAIHLKQNRTKNEIAVHRLFRRREAHIKKKAEEERSHSSFFLFFVFLPQTALHSLSVLLLTTFLHCKFLQILHLR